MVNFPHTDTKGASMNRPLIEHLVLPQISQKTTLVRRLISLKSTNSLLNSNLLVSISPSSRSIWSTASKKPCGDRKILRNISRTISTLIASARWRMMSLKSSLRKLLRPTKTKQANTNPSLQNKCFNASPSIRSTPKLN